MEVLMTETHLPESYCVRLLNIGGTQGVRLYLGQIVNSAEAGASIEQLESQLRIWLKGKDLDHTFQSAVIGEKGREVSDLLGNNEKILMAEKVIYEHGGEFNYDDEDNLPVIKIEADYSPKLKRAVNILMDAGYRTCDVKLHLQQGKVNQHELVNHPPHYTDGKIEVIEFIEDKKLNFNTGNAVKYISRAGKKDASKHKEDLEKAVWYLQREISKL